MRLFAVRPPVNIAFFDMAFVLKKFPPLPHAFEWSKSIVFLHSDNAVSVE